MNDSKKYPVVSKEVIDKVFTSDDGWTTVYEGPTIVSSASIMPQIYVPLQISHIFKKEDKE